MTQVSGGNGERITIIRPSFMKITQGNDAKTDGCRAALFNHILYWISQKARGIRAEEIQEGHVYYYARTEELTDQLSHAWEVCKVRKEVNALIEMGLLGKITNPHYGVDRTKHFIFGKEQCRRFLEICTEQKICFHYMGLPCDMVHLIYSSNAYMNEYPCSCGQMINISEHLIDISEPNDKYIGAITKVTTKVTNKEECISPTISTPATDATPHVVAVHTLFSEEASEQLSLIATQNAPENEPLQEESAKQESKKKARSAKSPDDTLKARVERVYGFFDKLAQETSGDPEYRYQRTKKATAAITEWLKGSNASRTEELLREVYLELWNMPVDMRSGFDWKRNMHIHSVLSQYDSRALAIKSRRNGATAKTAPVSPPIIQRDELPPCTLPSSKQRRGPINFTARRS